MADRILLAQRLRESAQEVMAFPHPSHCDHLHDASKLMLEAAALVESLPQAQGEAAARVLRDLVRLEDQWRNTAINDTDKLTAIFQERKAAWTSARELIKELK